MTFVTVEVTCENMKISRKIKSLNSSKVNNVFYFLRSSNAPLIEISLVKGTFQDPLATLFNALLAN